MANCELCGAEKTAIRSVRMGRATVEACTRCIESMGLETVAPLRKPKAPGQAQSNHGGYSGLGRKGKDIMHRGRKELAGDFAQIVKDAREARGWDKRELAHRMAERVNIIQAVESGRPPTDSVIKKLERTLEITLMKEVKPDENRQLGHGSSRGMTLGDYLDR